MTKKQDLFIQEYLNTFNATEAAKKAGYSERTAYSIGQRLLKNVEVKNAIDTAVAERKNSLIADRQVRQLFWSSVMNDENIDMKHRLRASELLAKSEMDFTEKIQADVKGATLADFVIQYFGDKR